MSIDKLLEDKAKEYTIGDYQDRARLIQALKETLRRECVEDYDKLDPVVRESLDMIMHKIGRIANGNPYKPDHWDDIAGYSLLVVRMLNKR